MTTRAANTGTYSTIGLIAISPPGCTGVGTSFYGSYTLGLLLLALLVVCLFTPAVIDCARWLGEGRESVRVCSSIIGVCVCVRRSVCVRAC